MTARSTSTCGLSALVLGLSLLLAGCGGAATPDPSSTAGAPKATEPASSPAPGAGHSGSPSPLASAAPSQRGAVWLDAGQLGQERRSTHAVALGTGEVLVVGSDFLTSWEYTCGASTNGSDSVEIGDVPAGVWERTTSLPSLRDAPAVVSLADGRALLTGGAAGEDIGWSAYSSTYIFDPATRVWSRSGLLNTARTLTAAAVLLDGRVLVAGGEYMDRESPDPPRILDSVELWDPLAGTWSRTESLAGPRAASSAVTLTDGRVLLVGGQADREDERSLAPTEIYDPVTGRWSSAGTLATARRGFSLVALADGGAIVAGGVVDPGPAGLRRLPTVERFDVASNRWSATGDLPFPVSGGSAVRLADGRVLLAGGSVREPELIDADPGTYVTGLTAEALLFDPRTGMWTSTTPMPSPRGDASVVLLSDGSAVFAGGSISEGELYSTPGCSEAHMDVLRYVPGS